MRHNFLSIHNGLLSALLIFLAGCDTPGDAGNHTPPVAAPVAVHSAQHVTSCGDAGSAKRIAQALSLEVLEGMSVAEATAWKPCRNDCNGLTDQVFDTIYDAHCIISIRRVAEYMGAYPSAATTWHTFDKATGKRVLAADVLLANRTNALIVECNRRLRNAVNSERSYWKGEEQELFDACIKETRPFESRDLDHFYLTDTGIVFAYSFDFRHVVKNMEPDGDIVFTTADIRSFLRPDGLLAYLIQE